MQLNTPLLAAKRLESARELMDREEWDAALTALTELADEFPGTLIRVSTGRYLNAVEATRLLMLQFSAAGLEEYRRRVDGWAQQRFSSAVEARDDHALRELLAEAYASSVGDEALDALAQWAWERGDASAARLFWTQLVPLKRANRDVMVMRYPDADHDQAAVHARLVLCSLAEGDLNRAADELAVFAELFPEDSGRLAGREDRYVNILETLMHDESAWAAPAERLEWSTFGRIASRNALEKQALSLGPPDWTLPLKPIYIPRWEHPRSALPERGVLARYPVTFDKGLFFHNGSLIHALQLDDGQPLWPLDEETDDDETPGKIYPTVRLRVKTNLWTPVVGVPRFTATVHNGRLYALMGSSILTFPPRGRQVSGTTLVCLNLAQRQGLLEWLSTPEDLFGPEWMMTGTPVAEGQHLYVTLLKTEPQIEVGVACLSAKDGSLVWQSVVGQALREPLGGRIELGHQLLTFADNRLFLATDSGAVAAVDALSGRITWVVTYPTFERSAIDRSDESGSGLLPPVYQEGTVFVKPNDGEELLAIDAQTGYVYWRRPPPGRIVHLLGVTDSSLIASGDHLWSIDADTGRTLWRFGYDDAAGYGYGRGVIAGDRIFWPTREDLIAVDLATGRPVRRIPLRESLGISGGHLIVTGGHLLIAGPDHLTALRLTPSQF